MLTDLAQDLHLRINERACELAGEVLAKTGVSMDTAVERYLCAIAVTKHLPYKEDIQLPDEQPKERSAGMSLEELGKQVSESYSGDSADPKRIFAEIERRYGL